jgi:hypothetical protein
MASLNGQTIASSYEQLLHTDTDGGGNGNTLVTIKDGDNGTVFGLKLATNKVEVIPSAADDANAFEVSKNDGTAVFTVDTSNSRVGIGTDSPSAPLHVNSTTENIVTFENNADNNTPPSLRFVKDSGTGNASNGDQCGQIMFFNNNDNNEVEERARINVTVDDVSNGSENSSMRFHTSAGGASAERMRIASDGNVGIQTSDTSGDLNLAGSFGAPLHILQKPSSQAYGLVVQGNSNANGARLGIAEADSNLSTRANTLEFGFDSSTDFIYSRTGKDMIIGVNSSERMRIKSDGSIVPASAGTLNTHYGDGAGDAIQSGGNYNTLIGHDAGGAITTGDANVMVGDACGDAITIGVNNCAIGNDALSAEDVGNNSTALGNAALASQNSDSDNELTENTGVGYAAGYYNVTGTGNTSVGFYSMVGASGNSHSDNTALGAYSGTAITTGGNNILIGYRAADAMTTGTDNVAIGKHAIGVSTDIDRAVAIGSAALSQSNITSNADGSIAVGYFALGNLTSGAYNTAIGYQAMYGHTTGHSNIAIGRDAMGDTDAGSTCSDSDDNIAIGYQCMGGAWNNANKSEYNVAMGNYALDAQLNGANANTCIGYSSGSAIIGGSNSVLLGFHAGSSINSGSNNIMIGYQAGTDTTALTTGDNNICIGYNSHTSTNSAANQIAIGQSVACTANSTVTIGASSNTASLGLDGSDTSWAAASSDERYKENIETSTAGLSFINDLRPVTYNWKKQKDVPSDMPSYKEGSDEPVLGHKYGETLHGFIAQEVKAAIDNHSEIKEGFKMWQLKDDGVQTVADGNLVPILVKAVQELTVKVKELETKLNNKES